MKCAVLVICSRHHYRQFLWCVFLKGGGANTAPVGSAFYKLVIRCVVVGVGSTPPTDSHAIGFYSPQVGSCRRMSSPETTCWCYIAQCGQENAMDLTCSGKARHGPYYLGNIPQFDIEFVSYKRLVLCWLVSSNRSGVVCACGEVFFLGQEK